MRHPTPSTALRPRTRASLAVALALLASLALAAPAGAAAPDFLLQIPEEDTLSGSAAGQLAHPTAGVADPSNGHLYVAESGNARISEFTAWGVFVKAWGWDVAPEGAPGDTPSNQFEVCTGECKSGVEGTGVGQFSGLAGLALDGSGDLYVYESVASLLGENLRVQKFNPSGSFELMWGGDVVAEGPNDSGNDEQQELTIAASGGSFKLSLKDPRGGGSTATTAPIPYNASAAEVKAALDGLSTIAGHGGSVTVSGGPGDATGSTPYTITFEGDLGGDQIPRLEVDRGELQAPPIGARQICSTELAGSASVQYQWLRNGQAIAGADDPTYTTTAADEGAAIQCQVTVTSGEGGVAAITKEPYVAPPAPAMDPPSASFLGAPSGGFLFVGGEGNEKLTCNNSPSNWQNAESFSFAWFRNGVEIPGATGESHTPTKAERASAANYQCAVTGTNTGGTAVRIVSNVSVPSIPAPRSAGGLARPVSLEPIQTVNQGGASEVCRAAGGDACKAGAAGLTDGSFTGQGLTGPGDITYNPLTDSIFVGDSRIQEFNLDGTFKAKIATPELGRVELLAADPLSGDLYFTYGSAEVIAGLAAQPDVHRLDRTTGEEVDTLQVGIPRNGLTVDVDGNVYVYDDAALGNESSPGNHIPRILKFDAAGSFVEVVKEWKVGSPPGLTSLATNVLGPGSTEPGDLYVSYFDSNFDSNTAYVEVYGPSPIAFEPPPVRPPTISAQYGVSVGTHEALLRAQINPRFWPDTTFHLEYGTEPCSVGDCEAETPVTLLTSKSINKALTTNAVLLEGLEPDTTYHFRFVSQSGGGGPVFGIDPDGEGPKGPTAAEGLEGTFRTFAIPAPPDSCPANEDFRTGPSARLPDCRAYEMVSPLEKNSADATMIASANEFEEVAQSALSGDRFAYSASRAFADPESAPYFSQYIADRDSDSGWASEAISPPRTRLLLVLQSAVANEFRHFSADLCQAWLRHIFEPTLADGAIEGYSNLYRRQNCSGSPAYEALTRPEAPISEPPNRPSERFLTHFLGASADGSHAIFNADGKLTAEGAAFVDTEQPQLYEYVAGAPHARLVCILPSGAPSPLPCGAGTPAGNSGGKGSNVQGAISEDGSRIFWTSFAPGPFSFLNGEPGRIYVRIDGKTTVAISQAVSPEDSWFWGANKDGSKAIFEVVAGPLADNLYEFDVDAKKATLIAGEVEGVVGFGEDDASRIYLASREDLDGAGPASAGEVNLYLREGGDFTFIGALSGGDFSPLHKRSDNRGARITADGRFAAFVSFAPLTGYDNTDAVTGKPDLEVFRYDAVQDELLCVSCNPTGVRPSGKADAAASIPPWERATYASRILAEDGQRLFFESHEALELADTNGRLDVYQWEAAGKGTCDEADPTFSEASQGCVELISSGQSQIESRFLDASPSGEDVFIGTASSLVPQDYGLIDVYDARVGGGFAPPVIPPECEGEACQAPPQAPDDPTPASSSIQGAGNVTEEGKPACPKGKVRRRGRCIRPRCPQGKRKVVRRGKPRCVPKPKRNAKRANPNRRAAR